MTTPFQLQMQKIPGGQTNNLPPSGASTSPFAKQLVQLGQTTDDTHAEDNGFGHTLKSFVDYVGSVDKSMLDPNTLVKTGLNLAGTLGLNTPTPENQAATAQVGKNIGSDLSNAISYYKNTPMSQVMSDAGNMVGDTWKELKTQAGANGGSLIGSLASGLVKMAQTPIEAATYTINDNGTAKPATAQQQAQSLQSTAGIAAQLAVFKGLKTTLLGDMPTGEAALNTLKASPGGAIRAGLNYASAEGVAGGISGGVQGAISGAGSPDQHEQIISSALTFAPLSAAFGLLGIKGYVGQLKDEAGKFMLKNTLDASHEMAAVNSMRINPADPLSKLIDNTDAVSSADKLTQAAINSRLSVGDGYIVEGVSPELGAQLQGQIRSATIERPTELTQSQVDAGAVSKQGDYVAPGDVRLARPRPNSTEVKFDSNLDKVAYLAAGKNPSEYVQGLVDNLSKQTGLSQEEIIAHGRYVREQQIKDFKTGKRIPRTQAEIDAYNQASIEEGKVKIAALRDGGTVKDNNGTDWVREGNNLQDATTGRSLPIDETNTLMQIGRKSDDTPFYQPYQQLPVQEWNPDYGRIAKDQPTKFHYSPSNGTLLVTPNNYRPDALAFFRRTGFMQREIVSYNGLDHIVTGADENGVNIKSVTDGSEQNVDPTDLRRTNHSLTPSTEASGVRSPMLSPGDVVDKWYSSFKKTFNQAPEDQAYSATLQRFYHDNGIGEADQSHIATLMTKKLGDDLATATLSPDELAVRKKLLGGIQDMSDATDKDHSMFLSNQALSNNLFYSPEGAGKYRLRFQDTGKTYALVGSPEEALDAINKLRQSNGLDTDGGYTGAVPTGISNFGGLTQSMKPVAYGKIQQALDLSRVGGVLSNITPVYRISQYIDNLTGGKTNFSEPFLEMQKTLINRRNIIGSNSDIAALAKSGQDVLNMGQGISSARRLVLADNMETMTMDQIKNMLGTRSANAFEQGLADILAKSGDVGAVKDLLYKAKIMSPNADMGGQAYMTNLLDLGQKYDPEVTKAASLFAEHVPKAGAQNAYGPMILRLAEALEDPTKALDQKAHARLNNISPLEQKYISKIQDWYKQLSPIAGVDPSTSSQMYLPSIIRRIAGGAGEVGSNEAFNQEMSRVGITSRNELTRDPNQLINKYFVTTVNHTVGFKDALDNYSKAIDGEVQKLQGTKLENASDGIAQKFQTYSEQMSGYPTPNDALNKSVRQIASNLGIKTPDANSVLSLMALGNIAGRPILAVRDFHNIMALSYTSFGLEFTQRAFADATNPEYVKALQDKNILPNSQARSMIDPAADEGSLIPENSLVKRWADKGFQLSGQEFAYEHANAGIYKASMGMAEKYFDMLQKNGITKDEAFDKLGISSNYGPGIIQHIDDHLSNGRPDLAADLYAQTNMRFLSHVYGFHNNPIGWQTNWGRLLSQWGSWSANASSTMLDQVSRGSKMQIAGKLSRGALVNAATVGVGASMGFNLGGWMVSNPVTVWPTAGAAVSIIDDYGEKLNQGQVTLPGMVGDVVKSFIPYGRAATGWLQGLDMIGQGQLIQGLGKAAGASMLPGAVPRQ